MRLFARARRPDFCLELRLNRIQYAQWKSREDNQAIAEQIFAAINPSASLPNQGQSGETQS